MHRPTERQGAALRPRELIADAGVPQEVLLLVPDQLARDDELLGDALIGAVIGERIHVRNLDAAAVERGEDDLWARGLAGVCGAA